jgi:cytoskeleton protein RodZ
MGGLGEELRAAREARNLSLSDVSERIHIRAVYLQSLEDEDYGSILAPVYVRGFLRTYARFLGLDPEDAVARFNATHPSSGQAPNGASRERRIGAPRRGPSVWLWAAVTAAVLLVGYVFYNYYELQRDQATGVGGVQEAGPGASPTPSAAATGTPAAAPTPRPAGSANPSADANALRIQLVQPSWLRVVVDGNVTLEGIYPTGTVKVVHGKTVTLRVGNAAGVQVTAGGRSVGSLGGAGDVVERTFKLAQE